MIRGSSTDAESVDISLGLGPHLVGKQIDIHGRNLEICRQLGEGGFSFVYLVRHNNNKSNDSSANSADDDHPPSTNGDARTAAEKQPPLPARMVLKITSVHNASQRQMAEKEAKLLQNLSHPSIVQVYDHGFREEDGTSSRASPLSSDPSSGNSAGKSAQHLILMEHCEGGNAFDAIQRMKALQPSTPLSVSGESQHTAGFDLPSLVISFGQICNAVSYLHAQRPPIIHRDLKPVNFLIKNGAYKLCDFGSAVLGHTDLRTPENRRKAEEVVNKTTTQMFRAPEMVDLYMAKRLTESTDVWALGCCLYSLAFLCDCFEEGSNLAILSRKYRIPDDNPYGDGLVELIDRMLVSDYKERADMSEVIMCLSALYSNRPLPTRKRAGVLKEREEEKPGHRTGAYRTDGQGIQQKQAPAPKAKKATEAKKLNPNSAAAKRKKASEGQSSKTSTTQISPPNSVDDDGFQNFASFDGAAFEGHFSSEGQATTDADLFDSQFDEQCRTSAASSLEAAMDKFDPFANGEEAPNGTPAEGKKKRGLFRILGKGR